MRAGHVTFALLLPFVHVQDNPESVYLHARDEILVRRRRPPPQRDDSDEASLESIVPPEEFMEQMGSLLEDDEHADTVLYVGPKKEVLRAHKVSFYRDLWAL